MDSVATTGYPATTKRAAGFVKDVPTVAMVVGFADKILITITQDGRLAQWVYGYIDLLLIPSAEEICSRSFMSRSIPRIA
jgi:hypothetical protein